MAVLPAEQDLRRVIGDGEGVPDGEVEGLSEADLLELHRQLVLLRTYDERSVVYHRQGRIGTYAIFWGHEAMQVGSTFALAREDWIFPSYRESAIGLLRGLPASTILMRPGSPGARSSAARTSARSRTSAMARPPRARSTRARTSRP
jgi:TPP-dependent pyruvate/acetoin dehydrogenase alpha subunit